MPAHKKQARPKPIKSARTAMPAKKEPQVASSPARTIQSGDLAAEVKRLAGDVKSIKEELRKRPGPANGEGSSRRDLDKMLADRLARLDEKIESLWGRVADLEEHFEGEGGRTRDTEFDETPDRDFYEH
jgi:hypothetical protein